MPNLVKEIKVEICFSELKNSQGHANQNGMMVNFYLDVFLILINFSPDILYDLPGTFNVYTGIILFIMFLLWFTYHLNANKKCFSLSVLRHYETNVITFCLSYRRTKDYDVYLVTLQQQKRKILFGRT